jgi:ABC-type glycerol-3-phosphate transport system permease component
VRKRAGLRERLVRFSSAAATHAVLLAGAVAIAFPFFWMIMTALKGNKEARGVPRVTLLPTHWMWGNFTEAWQMEPFGLYFRNTFLVAALVTLLVVGTALLAGYAFARIRFAGRRVLFVVFLATMMVPFEVVLVPNFLLVTWMKEGFVHGLVGALGAGAEGTGRTVAAFGALIVPWAANAFSIFLVTQFFRQVPQDYFDAAAIDGCGHWGMMWRIGAPMVAPALVTAGLFSFLGSWNALLWPLVINNPTEAPVVQVALARLVLDEQQGYHLLMAASTFAMLPIVVLYLVAQRQFIEGVTGVGLKG